jgi:DNA sulfur modification protein DndD
MLIEKLTLCDIGTYAGEQVIDLEPRVVGGVRRPIILFGGLNGAGKTTLLDSIRHCLYGRQALVVTVTQRQYEEHLRALIHSSPTDLVRIDAAHVANSGGR